MRDAPIEITITSTEPQATTLDDLISNDILVNLTDSVTIPPAPGSATITVPQTAGGTVYGDLRIELFDDGDDQPFAIEHFDIIYCLGVQTRRISDHQPGERRRPFRVPGSTAKENGRVLTRPMQSWPGCPGNFADRIVRTDWDTFYWYAGTVLTVAGDKLITELAGEASRPGGTAGP